MIIATRLSPAEYQQIFAKQNFIFVLLIQYFPGMIDHKKKRFGENL